MGDEWQIMMRYGVSWSAGLMLACLALACGGRVANVEGASDGATFAPSLVGGLWDASYSQDARGSSPCRRVDCGTVEEAGSSIMFDSGDAIPSGTDRGPCGAGNTCPTGSSCVYPIVAGCAATGECLEYPGPDGPLCGSVFSHCACDGGIAIEECYTSGYATAPVSESCGGGVDSGTPLDAGDSDAPIEAGTDRGPCGADAGCPSGSSCLYRIGSCDATAECIEAVAYPICGSFQSLCGCDGREVFADGQCGNYPKGYATGPTTGATTCTPPDD
jgi:hypothetical protein